ncbi:MAG: EamA family transporter [Anaerolineae bacterium]
MSGELLGLLSALCWALGSVLLAIGAKRIHVVPLNMVRCMFSAALFLVLLPFYGGLEALAAIPPSSWLWLVVSVLALLVVGDTLYFRSMDLAGVSWAMPVSSINPLWAVILASFFVGEPLSWPLVLGALLVVVGVVLVSRSSSPADQGLSVSPSARRTGLLMALLVSVLWAIGQVSLKPATEGVHSVVANSVRQPLAMLMLLGLTTVRGQWHELKGLDRKSWAIIMVASLLGTGIGTLLFIMAIQTIGAGKNAVLASTSPFLALPFSILWLRERPTRWTLVGTVLTTTGIVLVV